MTAWFGADGYVPHGFCLAWDPDLMAAVVLSNGLIAIAYLSISVAVMLRAFEPTPFVPRWLLGSFAAFVFCCGISHVVDDVTLWLPVYRLQALVLAVTALVSVFAALLPVSIWLRRQSVPDRY